MRNSCLADLYFLPPISFFKEINNFNSIEFESESYFVKQTYRNRCTILAVNGVQNLTIPLDKANSKQLYKDVKINYDENWISKNNTTLKSAYSSSPFFDDYYPYLQQIIEKKNSYLFDLNLELMEMTYKLLQLDRIITTTKSFNEPYKERSDFREIATNKKKNTLDWGLDSKKPYQHVFSREFVPNLSIVDLIFCEGPMAINYLE